MDAYEECLLHDSYGVMHYDKNDAIDYDNDESVNNDIIELNIVDDDGINHNSLQKMLTDYKQKDVVTDDMNDHLKNYIELLALLNTVM